MFNKYAVFKYKHVQNIQFLSCVITKNSKDYFRQMILAKHSIGNNFV